LLSTVQPEDLYAKPPNTSLANQHLYDVIWPGQTSQKPRGWAFPSNAKELKIGVPNRFSFKEFVTKDNATGSMNGYCIDVFTQALALLPYPVTYKFVPFGSGTENPHYDKLVQMVEDNVSMDMIFFNSWLHILSYDDDYSTFSCRSSMGQ
jgi:glutamate receptor, ionotropic, plant